MYRPPMNAVTTWLGKNDAVQIRSTAHSHFLHLSAGGGCEFVVPFRCIEISIDNDTRNTMSSAT